ncbi:hypothetical protein [Paenibacillus sonchi]|nr:hypothetical protein [Paenibacillus sonchi]
MGEAVEAVNEAVKTNELHQAKRKRGVGLNGIDAVEAVISLL